ncbi:U-box domain-containing protein 33-like isoform X3 [Quercus robur]|uniref:U-box domain-containing protein 33-like isoform X2 n=1 Tax=Quercus robur TaxID=38942 RepID=UPI002161DAF5|nr:U-box domain-containing protein 33-like isoform X2 [Quercus robur]XP_050249607.1 U-box domain-containing protein 33-like isoform X3 [Quercus robur]
MEDNIVHVALGKNVKEYKPILAWAVWALKNSGGKTICVIHVHQPAKMIPMMGAKFPANTMKERELRAYRELERQKMQKILDEYLLICRQMGVQAESRHIEMESIEEGIVELVCQLGIRKLVMGTAAYSKRTMDIKSKKARYVRLQASKSCRIQFICKGRLVHTREGILDGADVEVRPNQNCKTEPSNYGRSQSAGQNIGAAPTSLAQVSFCSERNASIYYSVGSGTDISSLDCTEEFSTPRSRSVTEGSSDEWFESSRRYPPSLDYSKCSASRSVDIARISSVRSEGSELSTFPQSIESPYCLSPPSLLDGSVDETLYAQLEKAMAEAEHARREAFQEAERRAKVEKNAIEAKRRAQVLESLCTEESKQRKEIEEALAKEKEEHEKVKIQLNKVMEDLRVALDKKSSLESQIAESDGMVEELELRIASVVQLLQTCKKERDEFLVERDKAIEAKRRAQVLESLCAEELKQRKEIEEALAKEKEEHEKVKIQLNKVMGDLQVALDKKSSLECKIAESDEMVEELELSIASVMQLLQTCEKERDEFLVGRDNAIKEAEELRRKKVESSSTRMPQFSEFSYLEIDKATQNFDPFLEIGEGRHGNTYKGILREIQVAIKVPHQRNLQDPLGFQSEVDTLNKLRHPNLVTLIGYCQEVQALIYEYLPNGSLEDRLSCKDNTPPLSWQIRICIATELCSALIFLHSCKPFSVLHGDLTPAKVLLDANFVSKLCDFGRCRLLSHDLSSNNLTLRWKTELKDTSFAYLDPQFHSTGELTLESDVYSFGITLLQLLTGRPPRGLKKEVKYALDAGKLEDLLDPLAGDWPFEQAKQLAHLALSCSEIYRENRLDLALDVWPVLEPMREDLCGDSSSLQLSTKEHSEPPSYFLCPISQDVMQNPHVATDGFTYEEKFLSEWFDGGHDTSPMTNLKLEHCNLVPNYALRSAIQEWQQKH